MRNARAQDHWRKIQNAPLQSYISHIDLHGHFGIGAISIKPGIHALCGLNGAGKTTIFSAIKDIVGANQTNYEKARCASSKVDMQLERKDQSALSLNNTTNRLNSVSQNQQIDIIFVDSYRVTKIIHSLGRSEIDEFCEAVESHEYNVGSIQDICQLVGKNYDTIECYEIEDFDEIGTFPYFKVTEGPIEYDSLTMGLGEHFLFYVAWLLDRSREGSVLLFEEPETHISVKSQIELVDFLARYASEKSISSIISTHSPFILQNIPPDNISCISRTSGNQVSIFAGSEDECLDTIFKILGMPILSMNKAVNFFVEDVVAAYFLKAILEQSSHFASANYTIDILSGTDLIEQVMATNPLNEPEGVMVGVFDSDHRTALEKRNLKRPHICLPGPEEDFEESLKKLFLQAETITKASQIFSVKECSLHAFLSQLSGEDYHDWVDELSKLLSMRKTAVISKLSQIWIEDNQDIVDDFLEELSGLLKSNGVSFPQSSINIMFK